MEYEMTRIKNRLPVKPIDISIVVPVYNEESNIRPFLERLIDVMIKMGVDYEVIFAMDPSTDKTEDKITFEIERNKKVKLIKLSRRYGQPAATFAGIRNCTGEYCVIIDVDLQDPPELIENLYNKSLEGFEVVCAKRKSRRGESTVKKVISYLGYYIIDYLSDVEIPRNTGDFRIMSRKVINSLSELNETHGFLRGLVGFVGFSQSFIEYDRDDRYQGHGKYNRYFGSLRIGMNGIIGFSTRPLQIMTIMGFLLSAFSFIIGGWYVFQKMVGLPLTPGLSTTILVVTFFAGIQLISLGMMGEYIGRIYEEVKRRPMYIIDRKINFED